MNNKDLALPAEQDRAVAADAAEPEVSALRASIPSAELDANGRCCGRKPIPYKRTGHFFCDRCCRAYWMISGKQKPNWAWLDASDGGFYPKYPAQEYAQLSSGKSS